MSNADVTLIDGYVTARIMSVKNDFQDVFNHYKLKPIPTHKKNIIAALRAYLTARLG